MRRVLALLFTALLAATAVAQAAAYVPDDPRVRILRTGMVSPHTFGVELATSGFDMPNAAPPTVDVAVWLDGVPAEATLPLIGMPSRFGMFFDLAAGVVTVGGISVGTFHPVLRFTENLRFPVDVTMRRGFQVARARATATILLPTVIVPGYFNELGGPDPAALGALRRHGYSDSGPAPSLFWFAYPSRRVTLAEGARSLAAYVRGVVLPATYAAKINVIGYSLGGLLARWNVTYDVDGWGQLVNRLILVGVPNEGAVMAYLAERTPGLESVAKSPLAHSVTPTFPFWRPDQTHPWSVPPQGRNTVLIQLNTRPLPRGIRLYVFYGSHDPRDAAGPQTAAGVMGALPGTALAFGAGDGIVLAASAEGLPIHGGAGVDALAGPGVVRIDVGSVYHTHLLAAGADRIAAALRDRFLNTVDEADAGRSREQPAR